MPPLYLQTAVFLLCHRVNNHVVEWGAEQETGDKKEFV